MVISSKFCMGQYRDDGHREDATHFISMSNCYKIRTTFAKMTTFAKIVVTVSKRSSNFNSKDRPLFV